MRKTAKKKRQQRAQSRQASALARREVREARQKRAALRAEKQWSKTVQRLSDLEARLDEQQEVVDGVEKTRYTVHFKGRVYRFGTRFRVQRWLKRERQEVEQMSWAERHVQWMIENNCDDHGNPWSREEWC